jgi:hypothetical protein
MIWDISMNELRPDLLKKAAEVARMVGALTTGY